jgi:hypothetical protein
VITWGAQSPATKTKLLAFYERDRVYIPEGIFKGVRADFLAARTTASSATAPAAACSDAPRA